MTKKPFVDNKRGATAEYAAYKAKGHGGRLPIGLIVAALVVRKRPGMLLPPAATVGEHKRLVMIAGYAGITGRWFSPSQSRKSAIVAVAGHGWL